jgi:branched-chain amino acid transport system substrate-binding protein
MTWRAGRSTLSVLAAVALVISPVACGGDGADSASAPATTERAAPATSVASTAPATATATSAVAASTAPGTRADGVLTIGTLLPVTGPGNEIGMAAINAVHVGIAGINERGGVLQQPVRWIQRSEGETADEARASIEALLDENVDAIIGPASSAIAVDVLDDLMAAGVVVCSPTANAMTLNDFPDRELFFRTVPSDSLTAQAMATAALNTGVDSYAVVYLDDEFGRPFAQQATGRLIGPEVEVSDRPFAADISPEQLTAFVTELAELAPRTILVIADSQHGWAMLDAMSDVFATDAPFIIVNDALRDPPNRDVVRNLPPEFREQIQGLSPTVPPSPSEPPGAYATNALDCLNLIALATVEAGTDDPNAIAAEMLNVSVGGSLCNTFAACRDIAEDDRNVNYQGPNSVDLTTRGDPARGRISTFDFDASGLDVPTGVLQVTELSE